MKLHNLASLQTIRVSQIDDVTIVNFIGTEIRDYDLIEEQFDEIEFVIHNARKILIDFTNVNYLSSLGLKKLLRINKKVRQHDGKLFLCCLSPNVRDVLAVARMELVFTIFEDEDSALAKF